MSLLRIFAQRIVLGLVAAWAVLTTVFVAFTMSRDWVAGAIEGRMRFAGASESEIERELEQYLAERGLDRPLREQYVDWMGNMLTLDWGTSFQSGEPVFPTVTDAVARTAMYVVPAITIAILLGLLLGLYAALRPDGRLANAGIGSAYLLFALPNFWIGGMLVSLASGGVVPRWGPLFDHVLPIWLTATSLLGGYVSYSRAHSLEHVSSEFVTLVRAKGASDVRVAVHVIRNAAIPLFSMLFTEALGLLVLAVFVIESLFDIDGFGSVLFAAIRGRDLPVVLGCTLVIIAFGIVSNIVQDVAYSGLDPRVDTGTR